MNENNFESLDEQQIAELYGDVLEEPVQVAGFVCRIADGLNITDEATCERYSHDYWDVCPFIGRTRCMRDKGW